MSVHRVEEEESGKEKNQQDFRVRGNKAAVHKVKTVNADLMGCL